MAGCVSNRARPIFLPELLSEIACMSGCVWLVVYICRSACVCAGKLEGGKRWNRVHLCCNCVPWHGRSPPISRGRHSCCFHWSTTRRMDTLIFSCSISFVCREERLERRVIHMISFNICQQWVRGRAVYVCKALDASKHQMTQALKNNVFSLSTRGWRPKSAVILILISDQSTVWKILVHTHTHTHSIWMDSLLTCTHTHKGTQKWL